MTQSRGFSLLLLVASVVAQADESLTVAVASNFLSTAQEIAADFSDETGISVRLSSGSTGSLYAQISNGAPYDVFLAADVERPLELVRQGLAEPRDSYAYANGQLVIFSSDKKLLGQNCLRALSNGDYSRVAIANPEIAPYGAAARAYLKSQGLWTEVQTRIVIGGNVLQTYQYVATGNATLGFVSGSQLLSEEARAGVSCHAAISADQSQPVQQGAVALTRSSNKDGSRRFLDYLNSEPARVLIAAHGYEVPGT